MTSRKPNIFIVLVNYNGKSDTFKCLDSLSKLSGPLPEILLVDNGSLPSEADEFQNLYTNLTVLRSEDNLGWAGGNNLGIRYALDHNADHVLLLNNDTIVSPELITDLLTAANISDCFGILGCIVCYMDEPEKVNMDGCVFNDPDEVGFFSRSPVPLSPEGELSVSPTDIVFGCCMLIRKEVFEKIGFIDEDFFLIHEESDFCLRAKKSGIKSGIVGKTLVWHKGSSSFQREGKPLQRYYDSRNLFRLISKHGSFCRNGRPLRHCWMKYLKHVYYMYSVQQDLNQKKGGTAVLEGVSDSMLGFYGPLRNRWRPLVPALRVIFDMRRVLSRLTKGKRKSV